MRYAPACGHRPAGAGLGREFDRLIDEFFGPTVAPKWTSGPAVNIWEHDDRYELEAELPGFKIEELDVTVEGTDVRLAGKRKQADRPEGAVVLRNECAVGSFERRVSFPVELDAEKATATLRHGVFALTLPKAAAVLPRKVQVSVG